MSGDMEAAAIKAAATAAGMGGIARIVVALHGGVRSWVLLLIEGSLGVVLGFCTAAIAVWMAPSLRTDGWGWMIVAGFAGLAGALGTRTLDMLSKAIERRLNP